MRSSYFLHTNVVRGRRRKPKKKKRAHASLWLNEHFQTLDRDSVKDPPLDLNSGIKPQLDHDFGKDPPLDINYDKDQRSDPVQSNI